MRRIDHVWGNSATRACVTNSLFPFPKIDILAIRQLKIFNQICYDSVPQNQEKFKIMEHGLRSHMIQSTHHHHPTPTKAKF